MVGRGKALIGPLTCQLIQASAHLDTDLQKRDIPDVVYERSNAP